VVDAMTGQEAISVAQAFNEQLDVSESSSPSLTVMLRGGAALSVVHSTGKPIKFTGLGEKISELEPFYPDRMAQRILGMGDIVSLVEKAQEQIDLEQAKEMEKKMFSKSFSLEDFMKIQQQMKMLGSLDQIMGMLPIPGISKKDKEDLAHFGEKHLKQVESIINSMTPQERKKPDILNLSRKQRIAKGCGISINEIHKFLKDFENMKKMMQQFNSMKKNFGAMGGKKPGHVPFRPPMKGKFRRF
jgi:signal recognition particle subunit SRP54